MNKRLAKLLLSLYLFVDRRGRRQAFWSGIVVLIALLSTNSITASIALVTLALIAYLAWTTVGRYYLTALQARKVLKQIQSEHDLVDVSKQPNFKNRQRFLGHYSGGRLIPGTIDVNKPFSGLGACIYKYSLSHRFRVSLVEIDGTKYVRKSYTPCDKKFYLGLRNNHIVRHLGLSPPTRFVSVPERTLWSDFVDGPSLTTVSNTTIFSGAEQKRLFNQLNRFHDALHELGLCRHDLNRGNVIIRQSDGEPVFIDLDEQRQYKKNNVLFKLTCRIDRNKLDGEMDFMVELNHRNRIEEHLQNTQKDVGNRSELTVDD